MDLATVRAVLLDMDGTLVDSDAAVERAWRAWADRHGIDLATVLAIAHGSPGERTIRRLLPEATDAEVAAQTASQLALEYDDLDDVTATPGAAELVAALDRLGLPWAVVTSADTRLAKLRLGAAGIDPPVLVARDDITAGKPDPEGYLRAAADLGVDPARAIVLEDAPAGIAAGRAAGAIVVGITTTHGPDELHEADKLAASVADALARYRPSSDA